MKKIINEIGDTPKGQYALGQVTGRAYDRMLNSPRNKKTDGVVTLDPKYGKVAQDACYTAARGQDDMAKKRGYKRIVDVPDDERHEIGSYFHKGDDDYRQKHTVKLSESQLRGMIAESVKKVLDEHMGNYGYHDMEDLMHAITSLINPINDIRYYVRDENVQKAIKDFEPHFHAFAQAMRNYCDENGLVLNS